MRGLVKRRGAGCSIAPTSGLVLGLRETAQAKGNGFSPTFLLHRNVSSAPSGCSVLPPVLDLDNTRSIYQSRSTSELVRSTLILGLCKMPLVVRFGSELLELANTALWRVPAYWVMKHTFFPHFCSGENLKDSREVIKRFRSLGALVIPDYSVEEADQPAQWNKNLEDRIKMLDSCATLLRGDVKFSPLKVM